MSFAILEQDDAAVRVLVPKSVLERHFTALTRSRNSNTIPVHIRPPADIAVRGASWRSTRSVAVGYILARETRKSRRINSALSCG